MKKSVKKLINWKGAPEHWPLLLVGTFIFIFFSGLVAHKLNRDIHLENVNIFLTASSSFSLIPLDRDSLGVSSVSSYELIASQPLHREQILANLRFEPKNNFQVVQLASSWQIILDRPLEQNQLLKATLTTFASTSVANQRIFSWAYQAKTPLQVISVSPANQTPSVPTNTKIILRLSHDNFYAAAKNFQISPQTVGAFAHRGRNLIFTPAKSLQPGTIYTVTLQKTLPFDGTYEKLSTNYTFSFETSFDTATETEGFSIDNRLYRFPSNEAPEFVLKIRDDHQYLKATLFGYDSADGFISDLSDNEIPWWAKKTTLEKINSKTSKELFSFTQQTANKKLKFPVQLSAGFYLVKLANASSTSFAWFQVSDLSAFSSLDRSKLLLWVNNDQGPVESAVIQVFGFDDLHQTNGAGIALFATPHVVQSMLDNQTYRHQIYLKITKNTKQLILPLLDYSSYKFSEEPNVADQYAFSWQLNQNTIQRGGPISFNGLIAKRDGTKLEALSYAVASPTVLPSYSNTPALIYSSSTKVISNRFAATLPVLNLLPGSYELSLFADGKYLDRRYILVSNCATDIKPEANSTSAQNPNTSSQPLTGRLYKLNEQIKSQLAGPSSTSADTNNYLYLKYQNGFKWYDHSSSSAYTSVFTPEFLPNFTLISLYFDGRTYLSDEQTFLGEQSLSPFNSYQPLSSGIWSQSTTDPRTVSPQPDTALDSDGVLPAYATDTCRDNFLVTTNKLGTTSEVLVYQLADGGLSLNHGGPSNLELSSLIALTSETQKFDLFALRGFLLQRLESPLAEDQDATLAMSGLIGLGEPLLNRVSSWASYRHDLNPKEKLFISLALRKLGAGEWQKQIVNSLDQKRLSPAEKSIVSYLER